MKPKKFNTKLVLKKQTIAHMNNEKMNELRGGTIPTKSCADCTVSCGTCTTFADTSCPKLTICA